MTSALAKVILLGEHAVVYGYPALAGAIDRRVQCRAVGGDGELSLSCAEWHLDVRTGDDHPVARALERIAKALKISATPRLEITTSIPRGAGLGSSSALCVAITRRLADLGAIDIESKEIERVANLAEACFHDNPSGVDVALSAGGGLGLFRRGKGLEPIDSEPLPVAIGFSDEKRLTSDMVASVATRRRRMCADTDSLLEELGRLAERGRDLLAGNQEQGLGSLFDQAQTALARLGVSSLGIERLVEIAKSAGATGAKLSGAGGGGAVIAVGESPETISAAWLAAGHRSFVTKVGARS